MFRTQYNFDHNDPKHFETPVGVSETIPDQSYTIQELFEKYRVGLMPDIALRPEYPDGDDPDIDLETFDPQDLTDVDDELRYIDNVHQTIKNQRNKKNLNQVVEANEVKPDDQN